MKVKVEKSPIYTYLFDKKAMGWTKDPVTNKYFLLHQQDYLNEKLKYQGHLFLNDVFDCLGMPKTKAGQVVGWIYCENNTDGDNYVDFGLINPGRLGVDGSIVLNFNVDGYILDRM